MSNPTHTSTKTHICVGCLRRYKKVKPKHLTAKYHDTRCPFFSTTLGSFTERRAKAQAMNRYSIEIDDFNNGPKFYTHIAIDGRNIKRLSPFDVAKMRKEGIAK